MLVKTWEKIFLLDNFSLIAKFDILHGIYLDALEEWANSMDNNFSKESGLFEVNSDSPLEIVFYALRTFDSIRRVAYLAYVKFLNDQNDDVEKHICRLMKIISNNKSAITPLCEFNYNDIGLALWILF